MEGVGIQFLTFLTFSVLSTLSVQELIVILLFLGGDGCLLGLAVEGRGTSKKKKKRREN